MTFKISNALRILSIILLVVVFFISYAGLPEQVLVLLDKNSNPVQYFNKHVFFYGTLAFFIITNTLFYILAFLFNKSVSLIAQLVAKYLMLLTIIINIFFCVSITFIAILNGQENFDYSSFAPFIYCSLALFVICALAFIISLLKIKKTV